MPVRRDARGRWFFRHTIELPPDENGNPRKKRLYGTPPRDKNTRAAAERVMFKTIAEEMAKVTPTPAPMTIAPQPVAPELPTPQAREVPTFREFVEGRFMEYTAERNKHSEVLSKKSTLNCHLLPFFGEMRLDEIRPLQIEDYKREKLKNGRVFKGKTVKKGKAKKPGLSKKTIDNHLIILRRVLNLAREWGMIESVPKHELYRPKEQKFDFCDFGEADQLIVGARSLPARFSRDRFAVGEGDWGRMIVVGLKTGMRIGELLALRWPHVLARWNKLRVVEATTRKVTDSTKSGKDRDIPLSRLALEALRAQRHLRGPYVFCDLDGAQLTREQCVKPLEQACQQAGLRRLTWHVLRHTFASHLVMRGVPLKVVQELLGHASIETTMKYAHLAPSACQAAVQVLDDPAPSFGVDASPGRDGAWVAELD